VANGQLPLVRRSCERERERFARERFDRGQSVNDVVVLAVARVSSVHHTVRVADHVAQVGDERAELTGAPIDGQVHASVDQRPCQGQVRILSTARQLPNERVQPSFVLLLEIIKVRHVYRLAR
jgi:hypothetical protein